MPSPVQFRESRQRGKQASSDREHAADRSDPETVPVAGDELADRTGQRRLRGSLSRTKKLVAAFRISIVCSSSALRRLRARISAAAAEGDTVTITLIDLMLTNPIA